MDDKLARWLWFCTVLCFWNGYTVTAVEGSQDGRPVIVEHPLDTIIPKDSPVTLNCKTEGDPPPSVSWYKDDDRLVSTNRDESNSHRVLLPTGSLFFLRVHSAKSGKEADSGVYYCVARNSHGEAKSRMASLKIAMLRDEFRTRPRNVQAVLGQPAVLDCAPPKGFPEPVVTWKKDDREITPDDHSRLTVHSSGNLVISQVSAADAGFYTCVASNMVGVRESLAARLSVFERPRFERKPDDHTAEVGAEVLFHCSVKGYPTPVIVWRKKDSGQMPLGRSQILDSKALSIDRVSPEDEGEYICEAKNPAGVIESSARLTVHAPPTFEQKPEDQTVQEGGTASFACLAVGNPPPARYWAKEGSQTLMFPGHVSTGDGRVRVATDGRLTVSGVRPADHGYYVCSALNAAGSNIAKAYLKVAGRSLTVHPPPLITHGAANQTLAIGTVALLPCKATGRTRPHVSWLKDGRPLEEEEEKETRGRRLTQLSSGTLKIDDLRKTDSALYTCTARNPDGHASWSARLQVEAHTDPSVVFERMKSPSTFPSAPSRPSVVNVTAAGVRLRWSPPNQMGDSAIRRYRLHYFSPELKQANAVWLDADAQFRSTSALVSNLRAGATYVFVVRAENDNGVGEPSAVSAPVRTPPETGQSGGAEAAQAASGVADDLDLRLARQRLGGGEQLVKLLEARTVNATAVKVIWRRTRAEPLIQGYYIKWQGPDADRSINVTSADATDRTVGGLQPYNTYTFFVIPYHRTVAGRPSNSLDGTTDEAPPSVAPTEVHIRMMNMTTLRISWRPPPSDGINGILKGYHIVVMGNSSKYHRNITTNERAASVTLFLMVPRMTYRVMVAAFTGAGVGRYHRTVPVTMDRATLEAHLALYDADAGWLLSVVQKPWLIVAAGAWLWLLLMVVVALLYCRYRRRKFAGDGGSNGVGVSPFIKITDGSVRDVLWMDHAAMYNTAQRSRLLLAGGANGGVDPSHHPYAATIPMSTAENGGVGDYSLGGSDAASSQHYIQQAPNGDLYVVHHSDPASGAPPEYHQAVLLMNNATLGRRVSPPGPGGHQYAHLSSQQNLSTFYHPANGGVPGSLCGVHGQSAGQEATSPYATTTLVMGAHRQNVLNEHRRALPPTCPPPACPPPGFGAPLGTATSSQSDSPPNTDVSFINSDGTGSSNGCITSQGQQQSSSARRSSKPALVDFLPPPPSGDPPHSASSSVPLTRRRSKDNSASANSASAQSGRVQAEIDRVNDGSQSQRDRQGDYDYETFNDLIRGYGPAASNPALLERVKPSPPVRYNGARMTTPAVHNYGGSIESQFCDTSSSNARSHNHAPPPPFAPICEDADGEDSRRNSMLCSAGSTIAGGVAGCQSVSSLADEEDSHSDGEDEDYDEEEREDREALFDRNFAQALASRRLLQPPPKESRKKEEEPTMATSGGRPAQPCMGVSASALSQSTYDSTSPSYDKCSTRQSPLDKSNTSSRNDQSQRLCSLPRQPYVNGRKDFV